MFNKASSAGVMILFDGKKMILTDLGNVTTVDPWMGRPVVVILTPVVLTILARLRVVSM